MHHQIFRGVAYSSRGASPLNQGEWLALAERRHDGRLILAVIVGCEAPPH